MIEVKLENREAIYCAGQKSRISSLVVYATCAVALAVSISVWFLAIRAPLWLDETGSWWQISAGFSHIWARQYITFPSYSYILWLSSKLLGTSELALRIPSILAMLGAVWLLYLAARELFSRELSVLAAIIFCLHPIVIFESIDVRPYAFAVLATNTSILLLLRMRRSDSTLLAALFGLLAAVIVSFHYMFALILPAFVVCFFFIKTGNRKAMWRQFGVALVVFALAFMPMIPSLEFLFHTKKFHVYELPPQLSDLIATFVPALLPYAFGGALLLAALLISFKLHLKAPPQQEKAWRVLVCILLAFIPLLTLYGISVGTSIHTFTPRHRLDSIPGIALCWAWLIERYLNRPARLLFCVALVAGTVYVHFTSPSARQHGYTWKYALEFVQKSAAPDNAPVLICSPFVESNYLPVPLGSAKTSPYFAPLSYYELSEPVVPLPYELNREAVRVGSQFLEKATRKHERFFALAFPPSYRTLDWLSQQASTNYTVRLGTYSNIKVLEFDPRTPATPPAAHASDQPPPLSVKATSRPATP